VIFLKPSGRTNASHTRATDVRQKAYRPITQLILSELTNATWITWPAPTVVGRHFKRLWLGVACQLLEARLWIASVLPTTRERFAATRNEVSRGDFQRKA